MNRPCVTKYDPSVHHRRSIRLRGFDYTREGAYFITLHCASGIRFGAVVNHRMALNEHGRAVAACWREIPEHFPCCELDEWINMPDHFHGILRIVEGTACRAPTRAPTAEAFGKPVAGSIPTIIRSFKAAATKKIRASTGTACRAPTAPQIIWQRNYYEIIIRNDCALNNIREYIRNNPANLDVHRYGEPRFFMGNRTLLEMPLTAFLASRNDGEDHNSGEKSFTPPDTWSTRPNCVVSGFLSPMERGVFDDCLNTGIPMIQILARGLPNHFTPRIQHALEAGRLLVMTPFDGSIDKFSAARAAWCNQYALHLATDITIGQLNPDGMLACLLADLTGKKRVTFLLPNDNPFSGSTYL